MISEVKKFKIVLKIWVSFDINNMKFYFSNFWVYKVIIAILKVAVIFFYIVY